MNIASLLSDQAQDFIQANLNENPADLMLSRKGFDGVSLKELVQQIKANGIVKTKVPSWFGKPCMVYGNSKSLEQCSSELAAQYKSKLVPGSHIIDLTGGLGVDTFFFSLQFNSVSYVEQDQLLCALARNNFNSLGADHIEVFHQKAATFVSQLPHTVDCIYLDPDRRAAGRRRYKLEDCKPNILELLPQLWHKTSCIMLKLSPMLDIVSAVRKLPNVKEVHVLSVKNDCKELLLVMERGFSGDIQYTGANYKADGHLEALTYNHKDSNTQCEYSAPLKYMYEPNSSLLKLGAFKLLCNRFDLFKLHPNSHLYTSDTLQNEFPGRVFKIKWTSSYNPKEIRRKLNTSKANVSIRNFSTTVTSIRKACKLEDGGEDYLFVTTGPDGQGLVINGRKT